MKIHLIQDMKKKTLSLSMCFGLVVSCMSIPFVSEAEAGWKTKTAIISTVIAFKKPIMAQGKKMVTEKRKNAAMSFVKKEALKHPVLTTRIASHL